MIEQLPAQLRDRLVVGAGGCWLWQGYVQTRTWGYGTVKWRGEMGYVHRVVYQLLVGAVPAGMHLHHRPSCPKHCANPDHLQPVTQAEHNALHGALVTHCPRGHAYDDENTYYPPKGGRKCRRCHRERQRQLYQQTRRQK